MESWNRIDSCSKYKVTKVGAVALAVLGGALGSCIKKQDAGGQGSETQYNPPANTVVTVGGHASDCAIETMHFNSKAELYGFSLALEKSWGNGVEVFLENPQDPNSVICAHPSRIIASNARAVRGVTVMVDGFNGSPAGQPASAGAPDQASAQSSVQFINVQNRQFLATEIVPGACGNGAGGQDGCVVWGVLRNDRKVSLVNGSCLGGYRIAGVAAGVDRNYLFANNRVRDLRGARFGGCFVLARRQWSRQPPQWSNHWDGPIPPYYGNGGPGTGGPGVGSGQNPYPIGSGYPQGYVPPWYTPGTNYGPGFPSYGPTGPGYGPGGIPGAPIGGPGYGPGGPVGGPGYGPGGIPGGPVGGPGYGPGVIPGGPGGVPIPPGGPIGMPGPIAGPACPGGLAAGPGCGPIGPGPGLPPYPWNSGFAFFPGWVGYGEPPWGEIIGLQAIDTVLNVGQYKLCRDASQSSFAFQSALACRLAGYLGSGPAYNQCLALCGQLFANKQAQNAYKDATGN